MSILVFEGMLIRVLMDIVDYEDAKNKTLDYIKVIAQSLLVKDYSFYY